MDPIRDGRARRGRGSATASWLHAAQDRIWLLLVILVPLWVNLWGRQPFELPKAALARTLIWLLAGLALAESLLSAGPETQARGDRAPSTPTPVSHPLTGPLALLALAIVVATLTAADRTLSLWGSAERAQGAVTLLSYLVLCLVAATTLGQPARARRVMTTMALTTAPLVLFGLAQTLGWNPFGLVTDARSPVTATLGRANFVGAYLALASPLTLMLATLVPSWRQRAAWLGLLGGQLLVIALTWTRSAWLATAVALATFALLWWGPGMPRRRRTGAWIAAAVLALSGPLAVLWLGGRQQGSVAARLTIWRATLSLIRARPLLGYGPDALGLVFPGVYPPELVYYQGREVFVDRAHNLLLDWGVIAGLPGVVALLLVLVTFALLMARALRRPQSPERRALLAAVLAAVAGNIANTLVSFDVTPTATATWLLMGLGTALAMPPRPALRETALPTPARRWALVAVLLVSLGVTIWQVNVRPVLADIAARSADLAARRGDLDAAIAARERAIARWPAEPAHQLALAETAWQQAVAHPGAPDAWLARAEGALRTAQRLQPGGVAIWLHTAQFYAQAAQQFGTATQGLAAGAYRQALTLAPNMAAVYAAWGRAELAAGDPAAAAPLLRRAVALDATHGEAYLALGAAELGRGRIVPALNAYQAGIRRLPDAAAGYAGLAHCYWLLDEPATALLAAEAALARDPQNAQALAIRRAVDPPD